MSESNSVKRKDVWDKIAVFIPLFSGLVAAFIIGYITYNITGKFQSEQAKKDNELKKIDLLVKLMPYISSNDSLQTKTALIALSALGYDTLATNIARWKNDAGSKSALKVISTNQKIKSAKSSIKIASRDSTKSNEQVSILADEEGNPILNEDGSYILTEGNTPLLNLNNQPLKNVDSRDKPK